MDKTITPLWRAIYGESPAEMFQALDEGANINECNKFGSIPLAEALMYFADNLCRCQIVEEMLRRGADPKIIDKEKSGPLLQAAILKDAVIMRILLKAGADPNREFGCAGHLSLYEWVLSDYCYDEDLLNPPDNPTPQEDETVDGWLSYIERMAQKYNKRPPDYVRVLREHGAKTTWDWKKMRKTRDSPRLAMVRNRFH